MKSSRAGSPSGEEESSVWTDASRGSTYTGRHTEDDGSYYTHYSEGSMGLAKRPNKKLSLVSYLPFEEGDDPEAVQGRDPMPEERDYSSSSSSRQRLERFRTKSTPTTTSKEDSFDGSSSTHKARGGSSKKPRMRPELSVITDNVDEDDEEDPSPSVKKRPVAEDLTGDEQEDTDGAETRSRRRERLARLARITSPPKADVEAKEEKSIEVSSVPIRERSVSPRKKAGRSLLKTPKYTKSKNAMPEEKEASRSRSSSTKRATKTNDTVADVTAMSEEKEVRRSRSSSKKRAAKSNGTVADVTAKSAKKEQSVEVHSKRSVHKSSEKTSESHSRGKNSTTVEEKSRGQKNPESRTKDSDNEDYRVKEISESDKRYKVLMNAQAQSSEPNPQRRDQEISDADKRYHEMIHAPERFASPSKQGSPARLRRLSPRKERRGGQTTIVPPQTPRQLQQDDDDLSSVEEIDVGRSAAAGIATAPRQWTPVSQDQLSSGYTVTSDNSSVVTGNLQEGPCTSQFVQTTRYMAKNGNGKTECLGYTQKCTSFVSGVWESCAGSMRYQTESRKNLLQLEMIAEQSVTTIFNGSGPGRNTPEAFKHSRELLEKAEDNSSLRMKAHMRGSGRELPFSLNMEGAISTLSEAVGLRENNGNEGQSVMDDMRHLFESFTPYYSGNPPNQNYHNAGPVSIPPDSIYQYRHGAIGVDYLDDNSHSEDDSRELLSMSSSASLSKSACDMEAKPEPEAAGTSIYKTVAQRGSRDRRSMMMELQRRRMKHVQKRKEDAWTDTNPRKSEEDTQKLRRLYLGLYDKIHDDDNKANHDDGRDDCEDEERDVVWAASEAVESLVDQDTDGGEEEVTGHGNDMVAGNSPRSRSFAEAEQTKDEMKETEVAPCPSGPSFDHHTLSLQDGGESVATKYIDSRDRESPVPKDESRDLASSPQPEPSVSVDEGDSDDDMYTAVGTVTRGSTVSPSSVAPDLANEEGREHFNEQAGACTHTEEREKSVHTTVTTSTAEMDDFVHSFLGSASNGLPSSTGSSASSSPNFEGSESSRPLTLLAENNFDGVEPPEPSSHNSFHSTRMEDSDITSVQSGDQTLADSTIVSSYSDSRHTNDMSMADSIYSGSRSTRTGESSEQSSQYTPEPSEVPPEIPQPTGPIPEYQVLYQISEEEGDEEESDFEDEEVDGSGDEYEGEDDDASFEPQNDVPFDEDVTLEEYQNMVAEPGQRKGSWSGRLLRWIATLMLAYYLGSMGLDFDAPADTEIAVKEIEAAPEDDAKIIGNVIREEGVPVYSEPIRKQPSMMDEIDTYLGDQDLTLPFEDTEVYLSEIFIKKTCESSEDIASCS